MLQLYPVYSLWNRRKTLTGSPDPMRANGTNKPCTTYISAAATTIYVHFMSHLPSYIPIILW